MYELKIKPYLIKKKITDFVIMIKTFFPRPHGRETGNLPYAQFYTETETETETENETET
jgi:hypothetical protein